MRLRFFVGLGALIATLLASACARRPTQLLVVVESDLPPERIACVIVDVRRLDAPSRGDARIYFVEPGLGPASAVHVSVPFSLGVTAPDSDPSRRVEITALAIDHDACAAMLPLPAGVPVVSRRVRTGFLREQTLRLPIFLANACLGVSCSPDETCEYGGCVAVPDIDPGTLLPTSPGQELLDAGALDASIDATLDAGALSRPRPAHDLSIGQASVEDPHGRVYPVGTGAPDTFLVAGTTTTGLASLGIEVADAGAIDAGAPADHTTFFLAKLARSAGGWGTVWINAMDAVAPYPVIERAVALEGGGYLACGSVGGGFTVDGFTLGGTSADFAFVLRLDATGHVVRYLVLDAFQDLGTIDAGLADGGTVPSARVFCTDLEVHGDEAWMSSQVWGGTALRARTAPMGGQVDGQAGAVLPGHQSLVLTRIHGLLTDGALDAPSATVVAHAQLGNGLTDLGRDGARLFARRLGTDDMLLAVEGDELQPTGTGTATGARDDVLVARVTPTGTATWSRAPVASLSPPGMQAHLRSAVVADDGTPWVALTVHTEGGSAGTVTFAGARVSAEMLSFNETFLCRLDPLTGDVLAVTVMPNSFDAGRDDNLIAFSDARLESLPSGALATTSDGYLLHAANAADGERVDRTTLSVSSALAGGDAGIRLDELDPVLGIVAPDGTGLAWQWTDLPTNLDWRLTHVVASGGYVAVAGYVEDESFDTGHQWRRQQSFFQILDRR